MKFYDGASLIGSGTLSGGLATLTTTTLPAGTNALKAVFGGDANYNPSNSSTVTVTVSNILIASSLNPSVYGQPVTFTATVVAGATGTVTFKDGATVLGVGTVSGSTAALTTSALVVATHDIIAVYGGDGTHSAATSPDLFQQVDKASPTLTLSTSGPSTYGGTVTITTTLPVGTTGTVTVTSGGVTLGSGAVNPTTGTATISTTALPVGSDPITASYGGDGNNNPATGSTTQTVSKVTPTVIVTTSGPSTFGSPVTITTTVPVGTTGTVTVTSGGVTLGSGAVNPTTGTATISTTALPVGSDPITASYGGDGNNNPATGSTTQTVSKVTPTVTVTTSGPSTYGGTVTITTTVPVGTTGTVTVTSGGVTLGSGAVNPTTGTVTISTTALPVGSDPITASYGGDGTNNPATGSTTQTVSKVTPTVIVTTSGPSTFGSPVTITTTVPVGTTGTVTVTSGGVTLGSGTVDPTTGIVTIVTTSLPAGNNPIAASYGGDSNNTPSTGSASVVVSKTTPPSTLTSSLNPSIAGTAVTFTDTLPNSVTGTVTFTSGSTVLGTATVTNGVASLTTATLPAGNDPITATYNGDANNNSSVANLTETVAKATPTVSVTTPGPSTYGGPVTITVNVPPGATGTITITSGGVTVGTGTVDPTTGTVTITTTVLPVGSDPIVASYGGDANNNPSSGSGVANVGKATPGVTLSSSANPSTTSQAVTFTAVLPGSASGTVTFLDGATVLGTGTITNGVATVTASNLTAGSHTVTASYGGDANDNPGTSAPLTQVVNKTTPVLPAPAVSSTTLDTTSPETMTESVPAGVTGLVSFYNGSTLLGTAPIVNGIAVLTVPSLPIGTAVITAATAADASNNAAVSPATAVIVTKLTPVLAPPAVSTITAVAGTPVTITETIPPGVTGPVSFYNGPTLLGTAPVVNGVATITVSTLPLGSNPITVVTPATPTTAGATSPVVTVTITKQVPTVALTSSNNPAGINQAVTFTAVTTVGTTGTVTFMDGATVLGVGMVNPSGVATFTTSTLTAGSHSINAVYGGDASYSAVTSAVLTQVVAKAGSAITLIESRPEELLNTVVTFAATVTTASPTPTGTVTFFDGTTVLGTAPMSTNGGVVVSFATSGDAAFATGRMTVGTHQITAVYSGDSGFAGSSSAPVTNVVDDFTNANKGATTQNVFPGDSTTYTFTLTPTGASTFLADSTLTVAGLPPGANYTITPGVIPAGSGATDVVLTVRTSNSLSAQNRSPQGVPGQHRELPIALGMLGLMGLGAIRRHRRKMPRMLMMLMLCAASLLPIAALSGCAGGYFTLTPTSYSITVTGTEGAIQHSATTTLVVQ